MKPAKHYLIIIVCLLLSSLIYGQVFTVVSWNLFDFGKTKSDEEIHSICTLVKNYDIIAIQEVVAIDPGGAQAVARMADALNRMGAKWDYSISDPTSSEGKFKERYAFIWKTSKIQKRGRHFFDMDYHTELQREPFLGRFLVADKEIVLFNFHAKSIDAASEVQYVPAIIGKYEAERLLLTADFNVNASDATLQAVYKKGFYPIFENQKTTLKKSVDADGNYLSKQRDNIIAKSATFTLLDSGIIDTVRYTGSLEAAAKLSDHVGIWAKLEIIR